jgi:hypothetical protein
MTMYTNTHTDYVTLIAFPTQKCLQERGSCYFMRLLTIVMKVESVGPRGSVKYRLLKNYVLFI